MIIPAESITVTGAKGTAVVKENGYLQMAAAILPVKASIKSVTWSVVSDTGRATISAKGLLKGISAGTVTVTATANDGSNTRGEIIITIVK